MNHSILKDLYRASYFIGIDSDGCVFDTMEPKHRNALVPALCKVYELEHLAPLVEEVWTSINLYSRERGLNRFPGLVRTIEELKIHPVLKKFPGVLAAILPEVQAVKEWIGQTQTLSNASLEREIERQKQLVKLIGHGREALYESIRELELCLTWSKEVNALADDSSARPFKGADNFLKMQRPNGRSIVDHSTIISVLSQSTNESLKTQWEGNGLAEYVDAIHGQESGSKEMVMRKYIKEGGFSGRMLMIGDSPSDLEAAQSVGACFYPVMPKHEVESWERLQFEAWPIFASGGYSNEYQNQLIRDFFQCLNDCRREELQFRKVS